MTNEDRDESYVVGVDFGTLSGRAVVVRVSDGAELGSGGLRLPARGHRQVLPGTGERLPPEWALQVPTDYVHVLRTAVPEAVRARGHRPGSRSSASRPTSPPAPMVPTLADGTPLSETAEFASEPHAYVKLWRHHAAQGQADRINALAAERGEPWLRPLRRAHLLGVGVRQGPADPRGGPRGVCRDGPLRGARGLDRVAAVRRVRPQRLHRRLQGDLPGRASTRAATSSPRSTRASPASSRTSSQHRDRAARRARRHG